MRKGSLVARSLALPTFVFFLLTILHAQESETNLVISKSTRSDRENAGLRGPVRSVEEERTYPAVTASDGKVYPELKSWNKTEYDRDGRIAAIWGREASREHGLGASLYVRRYTYNAAGHLLRRTVEIDDKVESEVVYRYDDQGRLQSITNSVDPGNPVAFRYDANGTKSKIATAKPLPSGGAVSASAEYLFEIDSTPVTLPEGGSAVTIYDDHDRPTEIQDRNANGEIVSRTERIYDEQGRVVEEKQVMDDPLKMIPAADQKKIFDTGEVSSEELRNQIAQFLGGSEMWSTKYVYDSQGRRTQTIRNTLNHIQDRTETSYNEHGDVVKEISQNTTSGSGNPEADGTRSSETIYTYEYDSYGNWTMKKTSSRSLPDGTFKDSDDEVKRTIEYY